LGRVTVLDGPAEIPAGGGALGQVRLEAPVVALHDDRFILRSYSPSDTIGGGRVVNTFAPKHRRKDVSDAVQLLRSMMNAERATKFAGFVRTAEKHGARLSDLAAATGWTNEVLAQAARDASTESSVIEAGGVYLSSESFALLSSNVVAELEQHHKREPLARGMLRETLREKLFAHSLPELFGAVIGALEASGEVVSEKDVVRASRHRVDLSDKDAELSAKIEKLYLDAGVEAPSLNEAMTRAGVAAAQRAQARKILQLLLDNRKLVRIQGEMFMHAEVIESLKTKLQTYARQHEPDRLIDVPTFKTLAGVSRKYAIPLLEYFDRIPVTRRAGDKRLILKI
ncbi:MAG TPA: SelB C-terminal domain-containing protein, partial [Pyrinomonadaceae bacterium]|nr:SelB C-terminal domain-containing protein [Pyrinomonadaceae bacterium]